MQSVFATALLPFTSFTFSCILKAEALDPCYSSNYSFWRVLHLLLIIKSEVVDILILFCLDKVAVIGELTENK